ncbi:hypothetical protein SAMN05444507_11767, partial [Pseudomonas syringae]
LLRVCTARTVRSELSPSSSLQVLPYKRTCSRKGPYRCGRFGVQNTTFANKFAPTKAPFPRSNVGANLFAKGPVQSRKIWRSKQCLREQVRSYKSPVPTLERRSELVRERARTVSEDLAFKTMSSRTSSLLRPAGSSLKTLLSALFRTCMTMSTDHYWRSTCACLYR